MHLTKDYLTQKNLSLEFPIHFSNKEKIRKTIWNANDGAALIKRNRFLWRNQWRAVCGWRGTLFFKAKFASIWIEWSSINSPLNWLLPESLLLMLSIPYHHSYTHIHREAIQDLKTLTI